MPYKIIFDEPLVKFDTTKTRFPDICPVCGKKATKNAVLVVSPNSMQNLSAYDRMLARPSKMIRSNRRTLSVPVCESHYFSSDDMCRLRILCIIGTGLTLGIAWMGYFNIGKAIIFHQEVPFWATATIASLFVMIVLSAISFRPSQIERAVKIIGYDATLRTMVVDFKNPEYREAFIKGNPTSAKLVKWIVKEKL